MVLTKAASLLLTSFVRKYSLHNWEAVDLVVESGEVLERATQAELIEINARYKQLHEKQYRFEQNLFVNPGEDFTSRPSESMAKTKL